jgi:hypothetical protein
MKKVTLGVLTLLCLNLSAQDYFQQEVNYIIDVELDDENHTLKGMEYIDYTNNSPTDLGFLWFHLWPNAYKDNSTALCKQKVEDGSTSLYYASENERGYIDGLNFKVDGKIVRWDYDPEHIDICKLILNKPIRAGESIRISTPFFVKIPDAKFSRLGHVKQSYMITQWYPKPAVYDKDGWHPMPYLDQGEFYSEFGSFDVSITLPSNYTVGATGDLQNKGEIKRLNQLAKITDTITKFSDDLSFPLSDLTTKTLRYTQNNIHDFGWFADKRFHVLKGEVEVPHTNEKVTIWTMFTNNEADLWKNSIEYMHDALYYYSLWNGDYPYKQCTAVDGTISAGGGMEYPNVTVIGESGSAYLLEEVIMHEVGHNWFYGMLGNNERDHPWMDEGLNSHNEIRYMRTKYPDYNMFVEELPPVISKILNLDEYNHKQTMGELMYFMNAWTGKDQPIELHSAEYTGMNYGGIVYSKTAIVFDYLMAYLGEDLYDKCMQTYFDRWHYKHPQPKDVRVVFEEVSGKDLSWFFEGVIKTTKQLDYSIIGIQKETKDLFITLENKGDIVGPVVISGVKDGKSMAPLWIDGFEGKKVCRYFNGDYDHIRIDYYGDMPETNRNNNIMRVKGMFKTLEPIRLQIIGSMYHPEKTQIFFIPMINYNVYNRYSYGLSFYNRFIPKEGFSYKITPMYSNGSKNLSGSVSLNYSKFNRESNIYNYKISLNAKKAMYDYGQEYIRFEPKLDITLKKSSLRSKRDNYLSASYVHLEKEEETLAFIKGNYTYSNARTFNPYSIHMQIEKGEEYTKANLILNYNYHINQKKRLNIRGYFGFVKTDNNIYNLQMSAWDGSNDYMFSEKTLVRDNKNINDIAYNQQLFIKEGGLKHSTNDSLNSNDILSTISVEYNLTNRFRFYAEAGTNGGDYAYGSGLRITLLRDVFNLYLPIYTEDGMMKFDESYQNKIRFSLNLNGISSLLAIF